MNEHIGWIALALCVFSWIICLWMFFSFKKQMQQDVRDFNQKKDESFRMFEDRAERLQDRLDRVFHHMDDHMARWSSHIEGKLSEGMHQSKDLYTHIHQRLAVMDHAQQNLKHLSEQMIGLEHLLSNKNFRGMWGESQLSALISDVLPPTHVSFQHTLKNGKRVDCLLKLPGPTGSIAIDSKFPMENYKRLLESNRHLSDVQQFKLDMKKHIRDIAAKYISPPETSESALMFIPAESILYEIYTHHPEVIEWSYSQRVWIVSPTTLMSVLTIASSVIRDDLRRQHGLVIQSHLQKLGKDFERFQKRIEESAKYLDHAHRYIQETQISAKKIMQQFLVIDRMDETE